MNKKGFKKKENDEHTTHVVSVTLVRFANVTCGCALNCLCSGMTYFATSSDSKARARSSAQGAIGQRLREARREVERWEMWVGAKGRKLGSN